MSPFLPPSFPRLGSKLYHSVRARYRIGADSRTELYAGMTNVLDREPPFLASGTSGTQSLDTIPGYYDVFGRSWYLGTRHAF
jgi:outer membrane receptor protein involved in Fe transport